MLDSKIYLFANWKMYLDLPESIQLAHDFVSNSRKFPKNSAVAVFPSALAMTEVKKILNESGIALGAQNTFWVDKGGYTGEVSSLMYKGAGCDFALVGHAERRHVFKETNHDVRQKLEAMISLPLTPVLCVGETAEERKEGQTAEILEAQIRAAYMDLRWPKGMEVIIAYEPVWAIGTGESCEPEEAEKVAGMISKWTRELLGKNVEPVILYGGSVRSENILSYLKQPNIQGVLVGGSSAKLKNWMELVEKLS